jgi:hydroxylamine reductase
MNMFCFQCQEALHNEGCSTLGVCGKTPEVAKLQDLLIWQLKGLSYWSLKGREFGIEDQEINVFVAQALFTTITNVNFDPERFIEYNLQAATLRDRMRARVETAHPNGHTPLPDAATWQPQNKSLEELIVKGTNVGILADLGMDPDLRSLRELLTYGLKGLAAYTDHAYVLDRISDELLIFLQTGLLLTLNTQASANDLIGMILKCGEMGVKAMALLDEANTGTYGHPEPTQVNIGVKPGPSILISGHDLRDLEDLLEQTAGKGINIYTHGEMLPAHAYPAFKKYPHLVGNYGGSWWHQPREFEAFGGAILMTTNCIVKPLDSYKDRIFTTGLVGWPDVPHLADRLPNGQKDFSAVIQKALESGSPQPLEEGTIPIGFAHNTVLSVADKVIDAVKSGAIKRFVVMAGCDGRQADRTYYTELAEQLPQDHVILTAGCAKYRYNKLNLGNIGGIPRVLDAGQCNDSYSLVVIAMKLAEAFGLQDINDLPVSYDIAWYEQKAVIVLLALLSLGVKHIRLGPTLPAFLSPGVVKVLVENFDIKPNTSIPEDLEAIVVGA